MSLPIDKDNQSELANTKQDADTSVTRVQGQYREEDRSFHRKVRYRSGSCTQSANPTFSWWGLRVAMIREPVKRTIRTKVNGLGDMRRDSNPSRQVNKTQTKCPDKRTVNGETNGRRPETGVVHLSLPVDLEARRNNRANRSVPRDWR